MRCIGFDSYVDILTDCGSLRSFRFFFRTYCFNPTLQAQHGSSVIRSRYIHAQPLRFVCTLHTILTMTSWFPKITRLEAVQVEMVGKLWYITLDRFLS